MVKLLENTFRAVNIGLVNELALMCDRMNIDVWEVVDAAKTKPFGFMAFYPGPGLGGHCIPIDPFYLSWKAKQSGFDPRFIELAGHINGDMPHYVVEKIADALNTRRKAVNGARILIAGVAYKRDIDDMRESPALDIMGLLHAKGATVAYADPFVPEVHGARMGRRLRHPRDRADAGRARPVRLRRDRHRAQGVRLRRDGRRGRADRRHAERDQGCASARVQTRRSEARRRRARASPLPDIRTCGRSSGSRSPSSFTSTRAIPCCWPRGRGSRRGGSARRTARRGGPSISIVLAARNEGRRLPDRLTEPARDRLSRPARDHRRVRRLDRRHRPGRPARSAGPCA